MQPWCTGRSSASTTSSALATISACLYLCSLRKWQRRGFKAEEPRGRRDVGLASEPGGGGELRMTRGPRAAEGTARAYI
jgi:hypothetical protein